MTSIGSYAFFNCGALKDVTYSGSESEWEKVDIAAGNHDLRSAVMVFGTEDSLPSAGTASGPQGEKTISVTVAHSDGTQKRFLIETSADDLRTALTEKGLISGTEGQWGLFVDTVDGERADYSANGSWWRFSKDGEEMSWSIDDEMISDGDHYEISYTIG